MTESRSRLVQERESTLRDLKTLGRRITCHPVYIEQSLKDSRLESMFEFVKDIRQAAKTCPDHGQPSNARGRYSASVPGTLLARYYLGAARGQATEAAPVTQRPFSRLAVLKDGAVTVNQAEVSVSIKHILFAKHRI